MSRERLFLYDTTLRDGAQTTGVDFSLDDKSHIAALLDGLGVDYIEGGYPGANPLDTEFFAKKPKLHRAKFTAFGMIRRGWTLRRQRSGRRRPARRRRRRDLLRRQDLGLSCPCRARLYARRKSRRRLRQSVEVARARGRETMLDCEHFFDGYKANPAYALDCAKTAYGSGARWIVLCDTNGGTLPHEVARIVTEVAKHIPGDHLGIHAHNDTENAVANSLAAVRAGARQIQGTLNGLGERCGNANLVSIIPTLLMKRDYAEAFEIGVSPVQLADAHQGQPHARRIAEPRAGPASALCRRLGLRDQGGHPCVGCDEGPGDL